MVPDRDGDAIDGLWRLFAPFAGCVDPAIAAFDDSLAATPPKVPRPEAEAPLPALTLFYNSPIRPSGE